MNEYLDFLVSNWSSPVLWLVILVSLATLARGADRMVDSAVAMSRRFGVPRVVVGATIVSLGTTMPEAVVSACLMDFFLSKANLVSSNSPK